jgi:formyltetrahydrofolate deformylase
MNMTTANTARLLITCEDKPGIVQAVSSFLYHQGANITALDQYATEAQGGRYFMRVEFYTFFMRVVVCRAKLPK